MSGFLPVTIDEFKKLGWDAPDFTFITGDAYVDHPSFGPAIISRLLESRGYRVAIISQPDWKDPESINTFPPPRLGYLVSAGNMDSMVNHYTAAKKRRSTDAFTPGGKAGKRPDNATIVYCNLIRRTHKDAAIIIGGIEASLRRLAHYDYWSDRVKRSVILDSQADILVYGMGERAILEIAEALDSGLNVKDIGYINGTAVKAQSLESVYDYIPLPDFDKVSTDKRTYAESFYTQYKNTDSISAKRLAEKYSDNCYVVVNPPSAPLSTEEMDEIYALPYMRDAHPSYKEKVSAIDEVRFSLVSSRGCFGGCNFCALTFHQGRVIQKKSKQALIAESRLLTADRRFKGYIHDVGGPTANFRHPACDKQKEKGVCPTRQCLFPRPCKNINADHSEYADILRSIAELPGVKKVFVRSGLRYDYMLLEGSDKFLRQLARDHISGQLKIAPEHISDNVLKYMGKPSADVYFRFAEKYKRVNRELKKDQYIVPYLMSSHPGSTLKDAIMLAEYIRDMGYDPEQVQDFYPTPSTISTCMYYTGLDPRTMQPVYVPRTPHEKAMQRALLQYRDPKNYDLVYEALSKAGRKDLIGYGKNCLLITRGEKKAEKQPYKKTYGKKPANKKNTGRKKTGR